MNTSKSNDKKTAKVSETKTAKNVTPAKTATAKPEAGLKVTKGGKGNKIASPEQITAAIVASAKMSAAQYKVSEHISVMTYQEARDAASKTSPKKENPASVASDSPALKKAVEDKAKKALEMKETKKAASKKVVVSTKDDSLVSLEEKPSTPKLDSKKPDVKPATTKTETSELSEMQTFCKAIENLKTVEEIAAILNGRKLVKKGTKEVVTLKELAPAKVNPKVLAIRFETKDGKICGGMPLYIGRVIEFAK